MPPLEVKILLMVTAVSVVYAFLCHIRLSRESGKVARWLEAEYPEHWQALNPVARNWHGGHPGIKLLYRSHAGDIPGLSRRYSRLRDLERQMLLGLLTGIACIGLIIAGKLFLGWGW